MSTPSNDERAERLTNGLFPNARLFERLKEMGAVREFGTWEWYEDLNPVAIKTEHQYRIDRRDDAVFVRLKFWSVARDPRDPNKWETTQYAMHFGPKPEGDFYLRVCDNPSRKPTHHFHHFGWPNAYDKGHIPADKSKPRIPAKADPGWFMDMLDAFLKTNQVPIEVI